MLARACDPIALVVDPQTELPRPDAPELVIARGSIRVRARDEPAAIGAEAYEELRVAECILRSQDLLEPAPTQVPDHDPGLVPTADGQPAAIRADGKRGHAAIPIAGKGRRPAPGRVGMAGIDEQDPGVGVIDDATVR